MINTIERFKKGDKITYSNGYEKYVNKPDKYEYFFDSEYYNPIYQQQIVKIERFQKRFGVYFLKVIFDIKNKR